MEIVSIKLFLKLIEGDIGWVDYTEWGVCDYNSYECEYNIMWLKEGN